MSAQKLLAALEPDAVALTEANPDLALSVLSAASSAISLKRIADAMTAPTNEYGETMAEAVGGNIRRAMFDVTSMVRQSLETRR